MQFLVGQRVGEKLGVTDSSVFNAGQDRNPLPPLRPPLRIRRLVSPIKC